MQSQVVMLFGRPAVGKYTVGRALAGETGFPLLHNHAVVDLVEALFPFGSPPFVALRERLWLDVVDMVLAAELSGLILTFAPERTVSEAFLPMLAARIRSGGGELRLVELLCARTELERRMKDPSREAFGKLCDVARYHELEAEQAFASPSMPAAELVIDTGAVTPTAAAKLIAAHLSQQPNKRADGRT